MLPSQRFLGLGWIDFFSQFNRGFGFHFAKNYTIVALLHSYTCEHIKPGRLTTHSHTHTDKQNDIKPVAL